MWTHFPLLLFLGSVKALYLVEEPDDWDAYCGEHLNDHRCEAVTDKPTTVTVTVTSQITENYSPSPSFPDYQQASWYEK